MYGLKVHFFRAVHLDADLYNLANRGRKTTDGQRTVYLDRTFKREHAYISRHGGTHLVAPDGPPQRVSLNTAIALLVTCTREDVLFTRTSTVLIVSATGISPSHFSPWTGTHIPKDGVRVTSDDLFAPTRYNPIQSFREWLRGTSHLISICSPRWKCRALPGDRGTTCNLYFSVAYADKSFATRLRHRKLSSVF